MARNWACIASGKDSAQVKRLPMESCQYVDTFAPTVIHLGKAGAPLVPFKTKTRDVRGKYDADTERFGVGDCLLRTASH